MDVGDVILGSGLRHLGPIKHQDTSEHFGSGKRRKVLDHVVGIDDAGTGALSWACISGGSCRGFS